MELVDMQHLKCCEHFARVGSNPIFATKEILMKKTIKAVRLKDDDCNCGKRVKRQNKRKLVYKKTVKKH